MFKRILIIGVGSLGGFFAGFLSSLPGLKELSFVDYDKVEESNLKNSIYRRRDLGRKKVYALRDILNNMSDDVNIIPMDHEFDERNFKANKDGLVFDCRDVSYDRYGNISARFYISFNHLIIDCRKYVIFGSSKRGTYLDNVTKDEIRKAAFKLYEYVRSKKIKELIEKEVNVNIDLNFDDEKDNFQIAVKKYDNRPDMIYDNIYDGQEKLAGHIENLPSILTANKTADIDIYVGSKEFPLEKIIIQKYELKNEKDVIKTLSEIANNVLPFRSYLVTTGVSEDRIFVELIPEAGGA